MLVDVFIGSAVSMTIFFADNLSKMILLSSLIVVGLFFVVVEPKNFSNVCILASVRTMSFGCIMVFLRPAMVLASSDSGKVSIDTPGNFAY